MASTVAQGLALIVAAASMLTVAMANRGWSYGFNYTFFPPIPKHGSHNNNLNTPNNITVGGSNNWHFGFNYSVWAFQSSPFYVNDTLVFKYDPPSANVFPHSVYLLPNLWSYLTCDLSKAKMIANSTQGGGEGFKFVMKKWQPYYFACGERGGLHCRDGNMKFMVMPLLRRWNY